MREIIRCLNKTSAWPVGLGSCHKSSCTMPSTHLLLHHSPQFSPSSQPGLVLFVDSLPACCARHSAVFIPCHPKEHGAAQGRHQPRLKTQVLTLKTEQLPRLQRHICDHQIQHAPTLEYLLPAISRNRGTQKCHHLCFQNPAL